MKSLVGCSDLQLCTRGEEKALPLTFTLSFVHNVNDYWFVRSSSPHKENNALGANCFMGYVAFVCCCIYTVWKKFLDKKLNIFFLHHVTNCYWP